MAGRRGNRDHRGDNVIPFRKRPARRAGRRDGGRWFPLALVALPLAAFSAVFFWGGLPGALAAQPGSESDRERGAFSECSGPVRITCVVDGDTFWYRGTKIRVADINAPELSDPKCPAEAELAERATRRLTALLNAGPFTLEQIDRNEDAYGRQLRVVRRDGQSLGGKLVAEGLAESWKGYRGEWC